MVPRGAVVENSTARPGREGGGVGGKRVGGGYSQRRAGGLEVRPRQAHGGRERGENAEKMQRTHREKQTGLENKKSFCSSVPCSSRGHNRSVCLERRTVVYRVDL